MNSVSLPDFKSGMAVCCLFFNLLTALWGQEPTIERPPNIILVMADDLGTEALGCYGGTSYATPVLDKLAQTGIQFTHAYAYPLCTPTRVSLMTGKYNFRNWKAFGILSPDEKTFGHLMQEQGYATCMVGKWQLQSYDPPGYPGGHLRRDRGMRVEESGFDEYCMWHTAHTEDKGSRYPDPLIYQNGKFLDHTNGLYGPDVFTDYLLSFIERYRDEPFFAYYPMALTHNPFVPTPDSEIWEDKSMRHVERDTYFKDMVEYTDKLMGRIIQKLEETGIREETLFIFYSDNGTHQRLSSRMGEKLIQGGKGLNIDAGTRVPLIINYQGKGLGGKKSEEMIAPSDFIPTLFDAIGRPIPTDFFSDGQSFFEAMQQEESNRRDWVFIDHNPRPGWDKENFIPHRFVKGKQYKLYADGRFYDVVADKLEERPIEPTTTEQKDLHQRYQHILDSLRRYRTFGYLESLEPEFDELVPPNTKIEVLAEGFTWSEGPVWVPEQQCLLFSDVPRNIIYKWTETEGVSTFLKPSGYTGNKPRGGGKGSNGLALDNTGKLLLCRHGDREIARLASSIVEPHPVFQSLATSFKGNRLNSPNDLICDREGNIYFTDPDFGIDKDLLPQSKELDFQGVFRLSPSGDLSLLTQSLEKPNGIALSPDEKTLYVANSQPAYWVAYDLLPDGTLSNERQLLKGEALVEKSLSKQAPDGMAVDRQGNIFATGPDGILVISPEGKHLGTIRTNKRTSNCTFNEDYTVLYVTCDDYLLRIVLGYKVGIK
ncbi:MAG: sulfatase-like hydrolase/transferase [Bacteroidota bacterium]